jgi:amino acid permease
MKERKIYKKRFNTREDAMRSAKRDIKRAIQIFAIIYLGTFSMWLLMVGACMGQRNIEGYADVDCGDNSFTRMIQVTHKPLINLLKK